LGVCRRADFVVESFVMGCAAVAAANDTHLDLRQAGRTFRVDRRLVRGFGRCVDLRKVVMSVSAETFVTEVRSSSARQRWTTLVPELVQALAAAPSRDVARRVLLDWADRRERALRAEDPHDRPALEFYLSLLCCRVLRNIFSRRGEVLAGYSAVEAIWRSSRFELSPAQPMPREGFWQEISHLFLGATGRAPVYRGMDTPDFVGMSGRSAARERNRELEELGREAQMWVDRYPDGLSTEASARRSRNRQRILTIMGASQSDWSNWRWQVGHVIRDEHTLSRLVELTDEEAEGIRLARAAGLPFAITPYYASLMDRRPHRRRDHAVRAQVIPSVDYVSRVCAALEETGPEELDFMGERDTSPVDLITRRYPQIAVFKPFHACAQICVYCQRNWEVRDVTCPTAAASREQMAKAIQWVSENEGLREILITGGDPLMLPDATLDWLLSEFGRIRHIERIRLGSRVPVVLPMRITPELVRILESYQNPPRLTICLVTHVEHGYELTPDTARATQALRQAGLSLYNQQVYTIENSRKFETVALRCALKRIGIDPYYCFNTKGKEETRFFRVPVARILQERKEEARLTPGTVRTDEPVFNLPRLGKNHLRAGQDHHVIGLRPDGGRVYEFLPWEKGLAPVPSYVYRDVPVYDYLRRLARRGERTGNYRNIWYYF